MSSPAINSLGPVGTPLASAYYAFAASGNFESSTGFNTITALPESQFNSYDVTNALQVVLDVEAFNLKLGLTKTEGTGTSPSTIQSTTYDASAGQFNVDNITVSASEFKGMLNTGTNSQIVSVGAYANMYGSFQTYVATYFGYAGGFASLFSGSTAFTLPSNDYTNMYNLLNPKTFDRQGNIEASGNFLYDLSGSITFNNISQLLRYAVDTNVFGNRDPTTGGTISSTDPSGNVSTSNLYNYGVGDGFMPGDLIFVPNGTIVNLSIGINPEIFTTPLNNPVVAPYTFDNLNTFGSSYDSAHTNSNATIGTYSSVSSATTSLISRTLQAPLLIRLASASDIAALAVH